MGPKKSGNKQSSISAPSKSPASAGFKILKGLPQNPEDYMKETDDVNRDELAADFGTHIPATEASFDEKANLEDEEEEAPRANSPQGVYANDSDEEGEVVIPNPTDIEEFRGAYDLTIEHRFRESIRSFQIFICNHYRIDETIP